MSQRWASLGGNLNSEARLLCSARNNQWACSKLTLNVGHPLTCIVSAYSCSPKYNYSDPGNERSEGAVIDDGRPICNRISSPIHIEIAVFLKLLDFAVPKAKDHDNKHSNC